MDGLELRAVTVAGLAGPLSITIQPGKIGALVVEDAGAAGRLADVATGCATPDSGHVLVAGERIAPRPPARGKPARVGLVPADGGLLPHLTVADNISYGLRYGDRIRPDTLGERVRDMARQLGDGWLGPRRRSEFPAWRSIEGRRQNGWALRSRSRPRPETGRAGRTPWNCSASRRGKPAR